MMSFDKLCRALFAMYCILGLLFLTIVTLIAASDYISRVLHQRSQTNATLTEATKPAPAPTPEPQAPSRRDSDTSTVFSFEIPSEIEDPFERHMRLVDLSWNSSFESVTMPTEHQAASNGVRRRSRVLNKIGSFFSREKKPEGKKSKPRMTMAEELAACDDDWVEL